MPLTQQPVHLSDTEIDAYWRGRLAVEDEERIETHFLDCAECRQRVAAVEMLIEALRLDPPAPARSRAPVRMWQMAAAVLAIVAAGATWQWVRLARGPAVMSAPHEVAVRRDGAAIVTMRAAIEAPTRSAAATALTVPAGVAIVVFDLDAREAGAPGAFFDVSLRDPGGRSVLRVQAQSSPAGRVEIPVHRSLLARGQFLFELTLGRTTVALPFSINGPNSQ